MLRIAYCFPFYPFSIPLITTQLRKNGTQHHYICILTVVFGSSKGSGSVQLLLNATGLDLHHCLENMIKLAAASCLPPRARGRRTGAALRAGGRWLLSDLDPPPPALKCISFLACLKGWIGICGTLKSCWDKSGYVEL